MKPFGYLTLYYMNYMKVLNPKQVGKCHLHQRTGTITNNIRG